MSKYTQSTSKSSASKNNSPLDPFAEFQKLRLQTEEINRKMMMGPSLFNPTGNSSNEMLGMVLNGLKEMRREIKEDVSMMKLEQENQKEALRDMIDILENMEENQNKLQEDVNTIKKEQETQKEVLKKIEENQKKLQEEVRHVQNGVTGIKKSLEEIQIKQRSQNCETDIRQEISGKWRDVNYEERYFSAKFEDEMFMIKWNGDDGFDKYILGVEHENGLTTHVEYNTIVQARYLDEGNEPLSSEEFYIENGRLVRVLHVYGDQHKKWTFERIGDSDLE